MKKALKISLVTALVLLACVLMLASCGNGCSQGTQPDHVHSFGEWELAKNATCAVEGEKERYCSCGEKQTTSVAKVAHTEVVDAAVAPTCTAEGLTEGKHCAVCNEVIVKQTTVEKTEHTYGDWTVVTPATCTEDGTQERACVCGNKQTDIVAATGHEAGEWIVDAAATCQNTGSQHKECTNCQTVLETKELAATGHTEGEFVVTLEATCTSDGQRQSQCTVCQTVLTTETINATGHEFSSETVYVTCESAGGTKYTCIRCEHSYIEESGAALGHDIKISGICSRCEADFSVDMQTRLSAPLSGAEYGFTYYGLDGYLMLGAEATNTSGKTIKYCWFEVVAYNTVGDIIYSGTLKRTGPVANGENVVFTFDFWNAILKMSVPFDTTARVEIANVKIEYIDGEIECGYYGYSTTTPNRRLYV